MHCHAPLFYGDEHICELRHVRSNAVVPLDGGCEGAEFVGKPSQIRESTGRKVPERQLFFDVIRDDARHRVGTIAVNIHETRKCIARCELPVDRALLVHFIVVGIESLREIRPNHIAGRSLASKSVCDECDIVFERVRAIGERKKVPESIGYVIGKSAVLRNRNDLGGGWEPWRHGCSKNRYCGFVDS